VYFAKHIKKDGTWHFAIKLNKKKSELYYTGMDE